MIPPFDDTTGGLPPGDHAATLTEISKRLGFTPRGRWLIQGLRKAVKAFWASGIEEVYIDGSFCTTKPDRIDPYCAKWRMWADHGLEFFIHPAMDAAPNIGFPEFFRKDRDGRPRGLIRIVKDKK